jgi:hypothetical protein
MQLMQPILKIFAAPGGGCDPAASAKSFFGLTPWFKYLKGEPDAFGKCVPQIADGADIWLIGLAVIDSLITISALVAFGFVIFGGVQYIVSQGDPEKTNQAKNTILNALIGMVIAILAVGLVRFVGTKLGAG